MRPRVHVYAMCWNEARFMPYLLRHYTGFAERVVIFDNESDDGSVAVARGFPGVTVETFSTGGELRDDVHVALKSRALEMSRGEADWVMVVDADELVWHRDILGYLEKCGEAGVAVLGTQGFNMVSTEFPDTAGQVYEQVKTGVASPMYSKPVVYSPARVRRMNIGMGAHDARPEVTGAIVREASELKLLHFALLGLEYVLPRCAAKAKRLSAVNRQNRWGEHYAWGEQKLTGQFNRLLAAARPLDFLG